MSLIIFYSTTCFEILKQVGTFFLSFKLSTLEIKLQRILQTLHDGTSSADVFAVFSPWANEFICKCFSETAYLRKRFCWENQRIFLPIHIVQQRKAIRSKSCLDYHSLVTSVEFLENNFRERDCLLLPSPFPQYRYFLYTPLTSRFRKYTKNLPQFRTLTVVRQRQQLSPYWKQTVRLTSPSFTVGWGPFNHPPTSAPQRFSGTQRFAIRSPAWPLKRYQASGSVKDSLSLCDLSTVSKAAVLSGSESNLWFFALHGSDSETTKNKKVRLSLLCPEHFRFLKKWNFEESLR